MILSDVIIVCLGLRFDVASVTSAEMSSAWAAAIPRMVLRRGAMAQPPQRRYSDSDVESIQSTCQQLGIEIQHQRGSVAGTTESAGSQTEEDRHRHRKAQKKTRRKRGGGGGGGGKNRIMPVQTSKWK